MSYHDYQPQNIQTRELSKGDDDEDLFGIIKQEREKMDKAMIEIEKISKMSEQSKRNERDNLNRDKEIFEEEKKEFRRRCVLIEEEEMRKKLLQEQEEQQEQNKRKLSISPEKLKEHDELMAQTMEECLRLASTVENTEYRLRNVYMTRESQALEKMRAEFRKEYEASLKPKTETIIKEHLVDTERERLLDEIEQLRDDVNTIQEERKDAQKIAQIERERCTEIESIHIKRLDVVECRMERESKRLRDSFKKLLRTCERQENMISKMGQRLEDTNQDCINLKSKMKRIQEEHASAILSRRDAERKLQQENEELTKQIEAHELRRKRLDSSASIVADANASLREEVSRRIQLEGELRYTRRLSENYKAGWIKGVRRWNPKKQSTTYG